MQNTLTDYVTDDIAGPVVWFRYCWGCEKTFKTPDLDADCPDCGRSVTQPCGFVGGVELARRIEAIRDDLPDRVDVSRLSRGAALDLLDKYE